MGDILNLNILGPRVQGVDLFTGVGDDVISAPAQRVLSREANSACITAAASFVNKVPADCKASRRLARYASDENVGFIVYPSPLL